MTEPLDPWDEALAAVLSGGTDVELLTVEELAATSGVSLPLLEALAREGLLVPRRRRPVPLYDPTDIQAINEGVALLDQGLPLGELLHLARELDTALRPVAEAAVEVFARYVRDSVEATARSAEEASERLVAAFETMLPAAGRMVSHHFQRLVIAAALRRLTGEE